MPNWLPSMPIRRHRGARIRSLILGSVLLLIGSSPPSSRPGGPEPFPAEKQNSRGPGAWPAGDTRTQITRPRGLVPEAFASTRQLPHQVPQGGGQSSPFRWDPSCERYSISLRSIAAPVTQGKRHLTRPAVPARATRIPAVVSTERARRSRSRSSRRCRRRYARARRLCRSRSRCRR